MTVSSAQRQSEHAHRRLRGDQQLALVEMVGGEAGQGQQQKLRPELQRHDQADGRGVVMGELREHQPVLGRALHPGADVGDEGAGGPDPIVEAAQRAEDAGKESLHDDPAGCRHGSGRTAARTRAPSGTRRRPAR